jgi:hypothetical protein
MLIEINVDSKAQLIQRKNPGEIICGWFFKTGFSPACGRCAR